MTRCMSQCLMMTQLRCSHLAGTAVSSMSWQMRRLRAVCCTVSCCWQLFYSKQWPRKHHIYAMGQAALCSLVMCLPVLLLPAGVVSLSAYSIRIVVMPVRAYIWSSLQDLVNSHRKDGCRRSFCLPRCIISQHGHAIVMLGGNG